MEHSCAHVHPVGMTNPTHEWDALEAAVDARLLADGSARRPADLGYEERMRGWMSEGLCPEEWAARNAQDLGCFSGGELTYSDASLDAWVQRLDAILFMPGAVDACRRHYLTADEM